MSAAGGADACDGAARSTVTAPATSGYATAQAAGRAVRRPGTAASVPGRPVRPPSCAPARRQCLDDTNLSTANGTQYQQYYCEGGYQQVLDFKPVAGLANTYTVVNEHSGKCLDITGASTA